MLHCVADGEEKALAAYVDRIMALLTPVLTIAMGLLVGGIVMSVMGAILSVTDLAVR
jgi:general secretion pathway protein F